MTDDVPDNAVPDNAVPDPAVPSSDGPARLEEPREDGDRGDLGSLRERRLRTREERKAARRERRAAELAAEIGDRPLGSSQPGFKVDFLLAGVQKGGTSTLHGYLKLHPHIGLSGRKEVHYFDDEALDWSAPDPQQYHRSFPIRDGAQVYGECTPVYFFWPPSLDRIRAYSPDIRFIVVFRNPIDRAFSQWSMAYARGEDTLLFDEAIRGGRTRVAEGGETADSQRVYSYVERGFYGAQVRRFLTLYPRAQLLPLTSEELFKSHRSALAKVTDFLGVPPFAEDLEALHINSKKRRVEYPSVLTRADAAHLADLFRDDLAEFQSLTGLDVSAWLDTGRYPE